MHKSYIFKLFAKKLYLIFCQYLSFSDLFLLSLKHKQNFNRGSHCEGYRKKLCHKLSFRAGLFFQEKKAYEARRKNHNPKKNNVTCTRESVQLCPGHVSGGLRTQFSQE